MTDFDLHRIPLPTGVELDVAVAGHGGNPPVILLHGFPESHRTWRDVIPDLARDHFGIDRFTLVGHDWGGAIAWMAALQHPARVARLVIVNAPHPFVFQKSLFDDPEQRASSQYITAFRNPGFEAFVAGIGIEGFYDKSFAPHVDAAKVSAEERATYIDQWSQPGALTAMLNWYRASSVIVPAIGETPERPVFLDGPFPPVTQPTLVIWGLADTALRPVQLDGLAALVPDLTVEKVDAGHFVPWENAPAVVSAMRKWGI